METVGGLFGCTVGGLLGFGAVTSYLNQCSRRGCNKSGAGCRMNSLLCAGHLLEHDIECNNILQDYEDAAEDDR